MWSRKATIGTLYWFKDINYGWYTKSKDTCISGTITGPCAVGRGCAGKREVEAHAEAEAVRQGRYYFD
jgi:hypothetical protein